MTNTVTACNTVNLLDKTTYDQQTRPDTELWAVDEESDSTYKGMVAGWAMPSTSYENLTLGESGTSYTAPANGYYTVRKTAGFSNAWLTIVTSGGVGYTVTGPGATNSMSLSVPVKKGDTVFISYSMTGTTGMFRFIYAAGEV